MRLIRSISALGLVAAAGLIISCGAGDGSAQGGKAPLSGAASGRAAALPELKGYRIAYFTPQEAAEATATAGDAAPAALQESDEPFIVVDAGPRGELPSEMRRPALYVVFSQPVVPLAKLGAPVRDTGLMKIEPPLSGVYRWYGSRLLAFESDDEHLPQRAYTVTVSDKLRSLGGKKLTGERSFGFETERLSLLSWSIGEKPEELDTADVHPEQARKLRLVFSSPVALNEIVKWIEVQADGRAWPFTAARPKEWKNRDEDVDQAVDLTLQQALPMDTAAELVLLAGARSEPGWLGTREEARHSFHTLRPFAFREATTSSWAAPRDAEGDSNPIYLEFTHPLDPAGTENMVRVVGLTVTAENVAVYGSTLVLNGLPVKNETEYTLRVSPELKDLWGRKLGAALETTVEIEPAASYVDIPNRGSRMLEAAFPPKIAWEAQNPLAVRRAIRKAAGPYERIPDAALSPMGLGAFPENVRHFQVDDLLPFLGSGGKGSVALGWETKTRSAWEEGRVETDADWLTVQVTDLGLSTRYGYNRLLAWATRLSTGEPVAGARVELLEGRQLVLEGRTDTQGLAVFDFPEGFFRTRFTAPRTNSGAGGPFGTGLRIRVTVSGGAAAGGDEVEFIPNDSHNLWRFDVAAEESPLDIEKKRPTVFLFTDRGLYRPGETLSFRGIDRDWQTGTYSAYRGPYAISVGTGGYRSPDLLRLEGATTATGGSFGSFTLPPDLAPGTYALSYSRDGTTRREYFQVANFERLRFQAGLAFEDRLFYAGDTLRAEFSASYLAGGALAGAPYTWYWTREPAAFNPGGPWINWRFGPELGDGRSYLGEGQGELGGDGRAAIEQSTAVEGTEGAPYRYRLEVAAQDAARQEVGSRGAALVHPAAFYVAARLDAVPAGTDAAAMQPDTAQGSARFLSSGEKAVVSWALVDAAIAAAVAPAERKAPLTVEFVRSEWKTARQAGVGGRVNLVWELVEEVVETRSVNLSGAKAAGAGTFIFTPRESGQWEVRLRTVDSRNRPVVTRLGFYVSGAGWIRWGSDDVDTISLNADKPLYAPGETARIMVRSPLPRGKYLLTLEREGILSQKIIELDGSARTIEVPIEAGHVPIVYVALSSYSIRTGPPTHTYFDPDLDKPKGIFGVAALRVDTAGKRLDVDLEPLAETYGPGEEATVRLRASAAGTPLAGVELSFMAVDRGVVDLIDYRVPDPVDFFYDPARFPLGVRGADSRSLLIDPVTYALADLQGGGAEDATKANERKDFRPTAVFEPFLVTGADGTVLVRFKLPDSLTTYRCTVVAVDRERFGLAEKDLRVSAPLTATAVLPRKLRWRDTGTVSLLLTNLESVDREATVKLEAGAAAGGSAGNAGTDAVCASAVVVDGPAEARVTVPAGGSVEVPFRVAAVEPGRSRLVFTLQSPKVNERIIKELAVDRPALAETVTTIGNLGADRTFVEEGLILPSAIAEGTGSLSVSLAGSRLGLLKEAVGYLFDYPYGCLEQRTAALLPLLAFGEHLDAFGLESPVADPAATLTEGLAKIAENQLADGSFPYWPGGGYGNYYVSLRVAHLLALADAKDLPLPTGFNRRALLSYLASSKDVQRWIKEDPYLRGYALWVRALHRERVGTDIVRFLDLGDQVGVSGWAFAGLAAEALGMRDVARSARDRIKRFIKPGTRTVDLGDTREGGAGFWGSETERYALALMLFHALAPEDDMTTRLAGALLERQRRGYWSNTNSSYWAVLAFGAVADAEARRGADFTALALVGGRSFLQSEFHSYGGVPVSRTAALTEAPLAALDRDVLFPLRLERNGPGTLFYTAGLRYGLPAELAGPRDEGLGVFAETLDSDGRLVTDGILTAGRTYTRRIVLSSSRDRTFVALRAPVPSGAEILDAGFTTTARERPAAEEDDEYVDDEYVDDEYVEAVARREIMDDEVRFYWDSMAAGRQEVSFRFRAVMPGVYPTPPAAAECMYEGEIFGRSGGELIRIAVQP